MCMSLRPPTAKFALLLLLLDDGDRLVGDEEVDGELGEVPDDEDEVVLPARRDSCHCEYTHFQICLQTYL